MATQDFVHLHVHSHYSLLDGACRLGELVDKAARDEQRALALTDHGNLFGAIPFYRTARKSGVKPILGIEGYLAQKSRHEKANPETNQTYHITLLAETNQGWSNLIKLSSIAFKEGFYRRPRVDMEALSQYSKGIVCLTGCLGGIVNQHLLRDKMESAFQSAAELSDIFGKQNTYLEVMDNGYKGQRKSLAGLMNIGRDMGLKLVATNDVHYTDAQDARAQDILLCINTGKTVLEDDRFKMESEQLFFRTKEQMSELFRDLPEALATTTEIADRCNVEIDFDTYHLPVFEPDTGETPNELFDRLLEQGARKRYGQITEEVCKRLEYEKSVIRQLGFVSYFLITWDFIRFARDNDIPVGPGRGSAAGSIVAYCLEITELCPLKYDLLFERFLNAERISMPDIDVDFCRDKRELVIEYVRDKYGAENVSQIITFGTMASRGVIRDVGRALDIPLAEIDQIAKKIPNGPGASLQAALDTDEELKAIRASGPDKQELFDIGLRLEGLCRHASTHAAGVVIANQPLDSLIPMYRNGDDILTQWQMTDLEAVGLLKVDFLGLKTLTIIDEAVHLIRENHGFETDFHTIPLDDPKTFELLQSSHTLGVFQLESEGMRELVAQLEPDCYEDIIALIALYRPGPLQSGMADSYVMRKHGKERVEYPHDDLEPLLGSTYGVIVYQEQVMLIANQMAGFSLNEADSLRKAMGKKKPEVMAEFREKFIKGAVDNGYAKQIADSLFTTMEFFAGYGFNKSHSAAYALLTYRTAWLKANYPVEYMCALMTGDMGLTDKIKEFKDEANRMGIDVLGPDLNRSGVKFSVEDGNIRYGLGAIKGMGSKAAGTLVGAREASGEFADLPDLAHRWDTSLANKTCYEVLIKAGAFDSTGWTRRACFETYAEHLKEAQSTLADRRKGQNLLFMPAARDSGKAAAKEAVPDIPEWDEKDRLPHEKQALGLYLSSHPFEKRGAFFSKLAGLDTRSLSAKRNEGQLAEGEITLAGMITGVRAMVIRSGRNAGQRMAKFQLEDLHGSISATVFSRQYQSLQDKLVEDSLGFVRARIDKNSEEPAILVDEIESPSAYVRQFVDALVLRIDDQRHSPGDLERVRDLVSEHAGRHRLIFEFGKGQRLLADLEYRVDLAEELLEDLAEVLGVEAMSFTKM